MSYQENSYVSTLILGSNINYESTRLIFNSEISYYLYSGLELLNSQKPHKLNPYPGFARIEKNPGLNSKQFNYFYTSLDLMYKFDKLDIYSGFNSPQWGGGKFNIILSNKAPLFFNIGYVWEINSKIIYEHFHGSLTSEIEPLNCNNFYYNSNRYAEVPRSLSAHKLLYKHSDKIWITLYETLIYGGDRSFEPSYYLPLVPLLPIQTYHGDLDNDQIGLEVNYFSDNMELYFVLSLDEWSPSLTFTKAHKNWVIWQLGLTQNNLLFNKDRMTIEYIWSDYRVYKHRFEINDYYSYGYPLGFWGGPHAELYFLDYKIQLVRNTFVTLSYLSIKKGLTPNEVNLNKYSDNFYFERYSEGFEKKDLISLMFSFNLLDKNFDLDLGINYIKWDYPSTNIGYLENGVSVIKNDYFVKVKYELQK